MKKSMEGSKVLGLLWIVIATIFVASAISHPILAVKVMSSSSQDLSALLVGSVEQEGTKDQKALSSSATENYLSTRPPIIFGSWVLLCDMPEPIKVHCYSQITDLGEESLNPQSSLKHGFPLDVEVSEVWRCHFDWNVRRIGVHLVETFEVWAHDHRKGFLDRCMHCVWKVARDGFYYQEEFNGLWYHQWNWHQAPMWHDNNQN